MKRMILVLLLGMQLSNLLAQILNPACGNWGKTSIPYLDCNKFENGDWVLVFSDEFNNNDIDRTKWNTCEGGWNREHGDELQYYLDNNIQFNNGLLKLTAKREPGNYDVWRWDSNGNGYTIKKYFEYTSGWIETKMDFEYGFFEIRCKIPNGKGFWPAFWLYGGEPEIDIFEFAGNKPKNHTITLHKWSSDGGHDMCPTTKSYNIDFSQDFHIFSAEWDEFKIVYRVDGDIKRIDYKWFDMRPVGLYDCQHHAPGFYIVNPLFPRKPVHVILNLAISCDGCPFGGPPNSSTVFPSSLEIDYIHIYKRKNPNRDISICNTDITNESSIVTGKTITVGGTACNSVISSKKSLHLFATDHITLLPGFSAELGSQFSAQIINGNNLKSTKLNTDSIAVLSESKNIDISEDSLYTVYPNPSSELLYINLFNNLLHFYKIELIDISDRPLYKNTNLTNTLTINLSNYSKGVYLLKFYHDEKIYTNKIIYK